jgi:uncharacterized protein (DUF1786 family)
MSRLRSIAESARSLPADEVYVMDSGMAAILGASMDPRVQQRKNVLVLDVATSHTVVDLANGDLSHAQILSEGGHGAYVRRAFGFENTELILATGPKRGLVEPSRLPIELGAPLGDNMMTGTAGVLEAIRRAKNPSPTKRIRLVE